MKVGKPLKVRGVSHATKIGIVADTLREALKKGCEKLLLPQKGAKICLEADGTLVTDEDYFQTLASNTCLVIVGSGQSWAGGLDAVKRNIQAVLDRLAQSNSVRNEVTDLLQREPSEIHQLLVEFVSVQRGNIKAERRDEDPEWFDGLEERFKTKSGVMFVKAQERVRGYFSKTKEMLTNEGKTFSMAAKKRRDKVIQDLKGDLKNNEFHGVYFMRKSDHSDRLCDHRGWFQCEGAYDKKSCCHCHIMNPYSSKESMVLFSTWNLDHVIEKSRSVIPGLEEAIRNCPQNKKVNVQYFYDLLFTRKNLKLVDIRCHKKGVHTGKVQKRRFYLN